MYGYYPDMVPAERFARRFSVEIVRCLKELGVSDLLDEADLKQILVYLNRNRPFETNGTFTSFKPDCLRRAQLDILHRLYSVWWAEQNRKIAPEERKRLVTGLRMLLVVAPTQDWTNPVPMSAFFATR